MCNRCGHAWLIAKEKMTDVKIATQIIIDAYNDEYDMAMLISGDSDLVPPINSVHKNFKNNKSQKRHKMYFDFRNVKSADSVRSFR